MADSKIIKSWAFLAFAKEFGTTMGVGECVNADTGETFNACTFTDKESNRTFVNFGKSLEGGLTKEEIIKQRNELQVIQLEVDEETLQRRKAANKQLETYKLCKKGECNWDTVDLEAYMS